MIYHSIAEIFAALDESHARLTESVGHLSAEEQRSQDGPERWSIAEVVEHISIVESQIAKLTGMMLHKAASAASASTVDAPFTPVSIEDLVARSLTEKYQAPETARPRGEASISDSLARIDAARAAFRELRPRLQATAASAVTYPHPTFGPLNVYQWLLMVGVHTERHVRQIEAIKETTNAER